MSLAPYDVLTCDHGTGGAPLKSAEQNQVKEFTCVKLGQKASSVPVCSTF